VKECRLKAKPSVGVFAGTFDPIHDGHLAFAHAALDAGLEKVMFLVEPRPRRKQGVRALEHRVAMVQLAIAHEPRFGVIVLEQARFTPHETLPVLLRRFAGYEIALLFGDDVISYMVDHIAAWPHIEELASSASLVIAARNETQQKLTEKLEILKKHHNLPFRYQFVEPKQTIVSSSAIRLRIKRGQKPQHVPGEVAAYIEDHGLYAVGEIIS
jgi:nicotinate-nucleotide adenylyltransferase